MVPNKHLPLTKYIRTKNKKFEEKKCVFYSNNMMKMMVVVFLKQVMKMKRNKKK
jgi:hypothetical protein